MYGAVVSCRCLCSENSRRYAGGIDLSFDLFGRCCLEDERDLTVLCLPRFVLPQFGHEE